VALPAPAEDTTALVTGASSGIGAAIARELAGRGHAVTLVARREDRLRELADELGAEHGVQADLIAADLLDGAERERLAGRIEELGRSVEVLVNNAGFGGGGTLVDAERERLVEMAELNCVALLDLQARYAPAMAQRGRGAIINVASMAAFQPMPGSATYAATKAFVLSLSEATHSELAERGVTVTALCPGPVRTEFTQVAGIESSEEKVPGFLWATAEHALARA
jgi:short-subunit dehydrogenase